MASQIVVVGSSNTDLIIRVKRIPRPGETILGGEFMTAPGGKGANQAVAAARAGGQVSFIGRVGDDSFGDQMIGGLVKDRIDVEHVRRDRRAPSGTALIFVAENGQNCIAVSGGANSRLRPGDIRRARRAFAGAKVLLLQLEVPLDALCEAARIATAESIPVILNPAPARVLPRRLLKFVSILTPNQTEAEALTGIKVNSASAAKRAAARLRERGGVPCIVITLGSAGALVADKQGVSLIPSSKVKPVDSTAAGDIFSGALATVLTEGIPIRQAVRFANAAAAISVTVRGAQPSAPMRKQIDSFIKRQKN